MGSINFKKIAQPAYQTYRILQAEGVWAGIYRKRVQTFGKYAGAIVFPEQLLGIHGDTVYEVFAVDTVKDSVAEGISISIKPIRYSGLFYGHSAVTDIDMIRRIEHETQDTDKDAQSLGLGRTYNTNPFSNTEALFSSAKKAGAYAMSRLKAYNG